MGDTGDKVILYAAQADAVLKAIERDGSCFSREEYVRRKYGESGPIFLTVYKWNKILCLKYQGEDEEDEQAFQAYLKQCGLREMDAVLTGFYPELKQKIMGSWPRLFAIMSGYGQGRNPGRKVSRRPCGRLKKNGLCRKRQYNQNRKKG